MIASSVFRSLQRHVHAKTAGNCLGFTSSSIFKSVSRNSQRADISAFRVTAKAIATLQMIPRQLSVSAERKPNFEIARSMPSGFHHMTNEQLLHFAARDIPGACRERLVREVMAVDEIEWDQANVKVNEIVAANKRFCVPTSRGGRLAGFLVSIPYATGLIVPVVGAIISTPLVFEIETAKWFNERFVTADVAEPKDLETVFEVGAWTWAWMEPVLGQISFLLLCLAFARNQMINLGWKPYSDSLRNHRSRVLQQYYPEYNGMILHQVSYTDDWI